jgi:hypothetical protein
MSGGEDRSSKYLADNDNKNDMPLTDLSKPEHPPSYTESQAPPPSQPATQPAAPTTQPYAVPTTQSDNGNASAYSAYTTYGTYAPGAYPPQPYPPQPYPPPQGAYPQPYPPQTYPPQPYGAPQPYPYPQPYPPQGGQPGYVYSIPAYLLNWRERRRIKIK